jgi:hypothetical protein
MLTSSAIRTTVQALRVRGDMWLVSMLHAKVVLHLTDVVV